MKLTFGEHETLVQIYEDITANFLTPKTIQELCNQYAISESKLTKGFRKLYDISINAYYLELRMRFAKENLKVGAEVNAIAAQLGYSTPSSFIRAFKKVFPKPPGNYKFMVK